MTDARRVSARQGFWAAASVLTAGLLASSLVFGAGSAGAATPGPSASGTLSLSPSASPNPTSPASASFDIDTASSLTVVVNKVRPLDPVKYRPAVMGGYNLAKPAADAYVAMRKAMAQAGAGDLVVASGYRDYYTQRAIFNRNVNRLGVAGAQKLTAMPGFSEHQTGLAADFAATGQGCRIFGCFANTKAGKWLAANAWQFGFILRYPQGATKITGYQFEPWHYRFVGKKLAGVMHGANAKVLETFLGLPAAPNYLN